MRGGRCPTSRAAAEARPHRQTGCGRPPDRTGRASRAVDGPDLARVLQRLQRWPDHGHPEDREQPEVCGRRRAERLEVPQEEPPRRRGWIRATEPSLPRDERGRPAERPRMARGCVLQRREPPHRPPDLAASRAEPFLDQRLDPLAGRGPAQRAHQVGKEGVDGRGIDATRREPVVEDPRPPEARRECVVHRGPVVRGHRMQRQSDQRCLHDRPVHERRVQIRGVESSDPVPERQVGRRGLLRLQRQDAPHGIRDIHRPPAE